MIASLHDPLTSATVLRNVKTLRFTDTVLCFLQGESEYEEWKYHKNKNIVELIEEFSSLTVPAVLLLTQLPRLQPRFYSISSSPQAHPGEIHATVAVVRFKKETKFLQRLLL
ncbi:nitric oxide synthase, brain [Paramuricea clavata]|uniref:nitric-oxide synthase (NADPH) n=1 Tax=Paramuricea clavata TaxID=317549 RepID=A0A6S7IM50_PARCT|nr:nitric oxide synthase, brain [Paramuricea clavata]